MSPTDLLILSFAVWRLTSLLSSESGPKDIFLRLRIKAGAQSAGNEIYGTTLLSRLLLCPWCLSVWVGLALSAFYLIARDVAVYSALFLALSAAAILIEAHLEV